MYSPLFFKYLMQPTLKHEKIANTFNQIHQKRTKVPTSSARLQKFSDRRITQQLCDNHAENARKVQWKIVTCESCNVVVKSFICIGPNLVVCTTVRCSSASCKRHGQIMSVLHDFSVRVA